MNSVEYQEFYRRNHLREVQLIASKFFIFKVHCSFLHCLGPWHTAVGCAIICLPIACIKLKEIFNSLRKTPISRSKLAGLPWAKRVTTEPIDLQVQANTNKK